MVYVIGIDDAHRSEVLGSLFVAAVKASKETVELMKLSGITDSKQFKKPEEIEKMYNLVRSFDCQIEVTRIPARELNRENINLLELKAYRRVLFRLLDEDVSEIYIDNFYPKAESFIKNFLNVCNGYQRAMLRNCVLIAEHDADLNYTICGAASIVAKYYSNRELNYWRARYDIGSTNPNDKKTQQFILENPDHPIIRKKWITYKRLMEVHNNENQKEKGRLRNKSRT